MVTLTAPYVAGFLAFREVPFLLDAVRRLREREPHLMPQAGTLEGPVLRPGGRGLGFPEEVHLVLRRGIGLSRKQDSEWARGSAADDFPCGSSRSFLLMEMGFCTTKVTLLLRQAQGLWGRGTGAGGVARTGPSGRRPPPGTDSHLRGPFCVRTPQERAPLLCVPPRPPPPPCTRPSRVPLPRSHLTATSHGPERNWPALRVAQPASC